MIKRYKIRRDLRTHPGKFWVRMFDRMLGVLFKHELVYHESMKIYAVLDWVILLD
jgi:hypothetical protein